jgi:hypothetical protein
VLSLSFLLLLLLLLLLLWLGFVGEETELECLYEGLKERRKNCRRRWKVIELQVRVTACGHVLCGAVLTAYALRGRIIDPRGFYRTQPGSVSPAWTQLYLRQTLHKTAYTFDNTFS